MKIYKSYNADGETAEKLGEFWAKVPDEQKQKLYQELGSKILGFFQKEVGSSAPVAPDKIDGVNITPNAALGIKAILIAINNNLDANQRLDLLADAGKQLTNTLNNLKVSPDVLQVTRLYLFRKLALKVEQDGTPYDMSLTPIINFLSQYEPQLAAIITEDIKNSYLTGGTGGTTGGKTGGGDKKPDDLGGGDTGGGDTGGGNDEKLNISISVEGGKGTAIFQPAQSTYKKGETVKIKLRPATGYKVAEVIGLNVTKESNNLYRVKVEANEEIKVYFVEELKEDGGYSTYQASIGYLAAGLLLLIFIPKILGSGSPSKGRF